MRGAQFDAIVVQSRANGGKAVPNFRRRSDRGVLDDSVHCCGRAFGSMSALDNPIHRTLQMAATPVARTFSLDKTSNELRTRKSELSSPWGRPLYCQNPCVHLCNSALAAVGLNGLQLHLNSGVTVQRDFQHSADSVRLTQLREECLHGTQARRFVR